MVLALGFLDQLVEFWSELLRPAGVGEGPVALPAALFRTIAIHARLHLLAGQHVTPHRLQGRRIPDVLETVMLQGQIDAVVLNLAVRDTAELDQSFGEQRRVKLRSDLSSYFKRVTATSSSVTRTFMNLPLTAPRTASALPFPPATAMT